MTTTPSKYAVPGTKHPRIDGVKTKPLRVIPDDRGWLMEVLRADESELFTKFGQVYISATYPGVVKAWHFHHEQVDNFACRRRHDQAGARRHARGVADQRRRQRVLHRHRAAPARADSRARLSRLEVHQHRMAMVLNVPTEPYHYQDPDEFRLEPHGTLPYDWTRQDG